MRGGTAFGGSEQIADHRHGRTAGANVAQHTRDSADLLMQKGVCGDFKFDAIADSGGRGCFHVAHGNRVVWSFGSCERGEIMQANKDLARIVHCDFIERFAHMGHVVTVQCGFRRCIVERVDVGTRRSVASRIEPVGSVLDKLCTPDAHVCCHVEVQCFSDLIGWHIGFCIKPTYLSPCVHS